MASHKRKDEHTTHEAETSAVGIGVGGVGGVAAGAATGGRPSVRRSAARSALRLCDWGCRRRTDRRLRRQ